MTRRERLERRLQRREAWAGSAHAAAEARFATAHHALDGIEPGQPILVGHHSERHHRRALERHDSNMGAAFERQGLAERHEQVAGTLRAQLDSSIYSDDANAVGALEARIREREAELERRKAINREIRKGDGWEGRIAPPLTEREKRGLVDAARFSGCLGYPPYSITNLRGRITADRKRLESIKAQQARRAEAETAAGGIVVTRNAEHNWCRVTFAEKPDRAILDALRAAGYRWGNGSWLGYLDKLAAEVAALERA